MKSHVIYSNLNEVNEDVDGGVDGEEKMAESDKGYDGCHGLTCISVGQVSKNLDPLQDIDNILRSVTKKEYKQDQEENHRHLHLLGSCPLLLLDVGACHG